MEITSCVWHTLFVGIRIKTAATSILGSSSSPSLWLVPSTTSFVFRNIVEIDLDDDEAEAHQRTRALSEKGLNIIANLKEGLWREAAHLDIMPFVNSWFLLFYLALFFRQVVMMLI